MKRHNLLLFKLFFRRYDKKYAAAICHVHEIIDKYRNRC